MRAEKKGTQNIAERWWWLRVHMFGHTNSWGRGWSSVPRGDRASIPESSRCSPPIHFPPPDESIRAEQTANTEDGRVCTSVREIMLRKLDRKYYDSKFLILFFFPSFCHRLLNFQHLEITSRNDETLFKLESSLTTNTTDQTPRLVYYRGPVKSKETRLYRRIANAQPPLPLYIRAHTRTSVPRIRRCRGSVRFASSRE